MSEPLQKRKAGGKRRNPPSEATLRRMAEARAARLSGAKLAQFRRSASMTQADVAEACGLSNLDFVSRWEVRGVMMSGEVLIRFLYAAGAIDEVTFWSVVQ